MRLIAPAGRFAFLALLGLFMAAPLVVVTGASFNDTARMSFPPTNPGLTWYGAFFADAGWMSSFYTSIVIALAAAVLATSIALPVAYAVWKYRSRAALVLDGIGRLSFMLPSIVLSIVFLLFWSWLGHTGRIENTIVSHAVVFVAMPLAMITLGLGTIETALIEAARTMGASEAGVFRTMILPMLRPYIVSGLVFVFIMSLNEYIIAYMVAGFEVETLPIKVFNNLRMGFQPTMCVGAVLFMLVGLVGFGLIALIGDLPKLLGGQSE